MGSENQQVEDLLNRITRWRKETILYRFGNIFLFLLARVGIPVGAIITGITIASNSAHNKNEPWLILGIGIGITILSTLDSILNPWDKKRIAFKKSNELNFLKTELQIKSVNADPKELETLLLSTNERLKKILDDYAESGY